MRYAQKLSSVAVLPLEFELLRCEECNDESVMSCKKAEATSFMI
jgi:hypothetical protein